MVWHGYLMVWHAVTAIRGVRVWHASVVCMRTYVAGHYTCGMGKRTSIYLTDDLAGAVKASGLTLSQHLRRSVELGTDEDRLRRIVREELAAQLGRTAVRTPEREPERATVHTPVQARSDDDRPAKRMQEPAASACTHPKARVHKGLCGACGQHAA